MRTITRDEIMKIIRQRLERAGSQRALAKELGISTQYMNDILRNNREPGPLVLRALGIEKHVVYTSSDRK